MFRIGDFSRFARVSVKMLRHYDEIGLLRPARVDAVTGYRYYSADQLPRLNQIILLKDLGFALDAIAHLLDASLEPAEIQGVLKVRRVEVERQIAAETQRLAQLQLALQHLDATAALPHAPILLRAVPTQKMLCLRRRVRAVELAALFDQIEAIAARHNARAPSPPLLIYHDVDYRDDLQDCEAAVPLSQGVVIGDDAPEGARVRDVKGGEMACILYTGDYAAADTLIQRYPVWMEAQGYVADGPLREVYLRFGADQRGYALPAAWLAESQAAYITELQLPVRRQNMQPS